MLCVYGYVCTVCVITWSQNDIHMCYEWMCYDLRMALYMRIYADLGVLRYWNFLHVVLNTTCDSCWCYVMWILMLYYAVMCVYVDNYVDNLLFCVDNLLLHLQHFANFFVNDRLLLYFRALSLVCSYLLLFSHFFIISW